MIRVRADSEVMLCGQDQFREYIGMLHQCKEMGHFWGMNGVFDEPNEAYLPGWMGYGGDEE